MTKEEVPVSLSSKAEKIPEPVLRFAGPGDGREIVRLITELATYEKEPDAVTASVEEMEKQLASEKPPFECLLAEREGRTIGFALFYPNYSTWRGKPGLYLEDLFVEPDQRGGGVGKKLLQRMAEICRERGYARMEWQVLDWNQSAIGFYDSLGAKPIKGWTKYRLDGDALQNFK